MQDRRAFIFANGKQINLAAVKAMLRPGDDIIAADGGLHHVQRLGTEPVLVIGDLDSLEPGEVEALKQTSIRVEQYPVHKDETDLELAVEAAVRAGYRQIFILAALGGRLDMTLANIFLLTLPSLANVDVRLEDGLEEVFLIRPGVERVITGLIGDRVSLLPFGGPAQGIRTRGLYYPLRGETLYPERTRGVSNEMLEQQAGVSLESGLLICIHTRQSPHLTSSLEEKTE